MECLLLPNWTGAPSTRPIMWSKLTQLFTVIITNVILLQMHFLRASVLQQALSTPYVRVPKSIHPDIVVSDYCSCHRLQDNVKALTEAIVFAVDNRKSCILGIVWIF